MSMGPIYLDAVLEPPRSLSPRGFNLVMGALGAVSAISGLSFLSAGAWPVTGFLGLEILLLWLVFRASFRAQRARTYVRVTADQIVVRKIDGWGRERGASLSAHFARVEFDRALRGPFSLRLSSSGRAYALGEHLTPKERESFARRLSQALLEARGERHMEQDA